MRDLRDPEVQKYRRVELELQVIGMMGGKGEGIFLIPVPNYCDLKVIASSGSGWDHVSVSLPYRSPSWEEMEIVRKIFSNTSEVWVQFGVPEKEHVNYHPYCLHWWRDQHRPYRLPPSIMVGPK